MKYLDYELYKKVCLPDGEVYEESWNKQYEKYLEEFKQLMPQLPKKFCSEYTKRFFHDTVVTAFHTQLVRYKNRCHYNITLEVCDACDRNVLHVLTFCDVKSVTSNIKFNESSGYFDWLYSELLPLNNRYLSFEILLYDDSFLYFEFKKLRYLKKRNNNTE